MPAQDGAGRDDEPHRCEAVDRQRPGQQRQPCPIRPRQPRMSPRLLAEGDRELMAQHEDLGVFRPRLPARQPEQRHRTGDDQEDQLQAHKPRIIAPSGQGSTGPPGTKHATEPTARRGVSLHVALVIGTHSRAAPWRSATLNRRTSSVGRLLPLLGPSGHGGVGAVQPQETGRASWAPVNGPARARRVAAAILPAIQP
jgi:hypothetical protein